MKKSNNNIIIGAIAAVAALVGYRAITASRVQAPAPTPSLPPSTGGGGTDVGDVIDTGTQIIEAAGSLFGNKLKITSIDRAQRTIDFNYGGGLFSRGNTVTGVAHSYVIGQLAINALLPFKNPQTGDVLYFGNQDSIILTYKGKTVTANFVTGQITN